MAQLMAGLLTGLVVGALVVWWVGQRARRRQLEDAQRGIERATADLQEAEREGAQRERAQDLILDAMEEGVLLLDPAGDRVYANRAFGDLLGAAPDRAIDLHPLGLQRVVGSAKASANVTRTEVEVGSPSRWLRATALPVDAEGAILVVIRDVTQARRLTATRR